MGKALIVCASRTGETVEIGNLIAEGIRIEGHEASVVKVDTIKSEKDLMDYDALVLGSATYHGDMLNAMKTMLFLGEKAELNGTVGGAFGAFGWSGEAPDRLFDTMQHIFKMNMVNGPLRLKSSIINGAIKMAQDYGRNIASKMA